MHDRPVWYARFRRWVSVGAPILTVAWLITTHLPQAQAAKLNVLESDWLAHGSGYMVMAACWLAWIRLRFQARPIRTAILVWFTLIALGAIDEVTQPWVGRDCSQTDWLSDAVGAAIGVTIVSVVFRRLALRSGKEEVLNHVHDRVDVAEHHPERNDP